ncbi:MAG: response regulator, partial [Acidobacteria bacterium]|nr:response regulator [Acidobacteriota bacterium]
IVLVEDNESVRSFAARVLAAQGYVVDAFANGPDALAAAPTIPGRIDLLLTDVVMPDMNGKVLAERLVALRPGLRVLFTSGYTENVVVHHGVLTPGVEFLQKPYTVASLIDRVRAVLDRE